MELLSDPPRPLRWAVSKAMRRLVSAERTEARHAKAERMRLKAGHGHVVEYFHQLDDGYSHLAAQLLRPLLNAYDIELVGHLVPPPDPRNAPEQELLAELSRRDAASIAPHYGLRFDGAAAPQPELLDLGTRMLAGAAGEAFADLAPQVGEALWSSSTDAMQSLAQQAPPVDAASAAQALASGAARRRRLRHYSGAMFHYGGEWYWGVDRLYHLERRLRELGAGKSAGGLLAPRPAVETGPNKEGDSLTLEVYPSIRSPYTSLVFDQAVELAKATGVQLAVRPVLPMVMRDVPVPREKGMYIFMDAAREARALGLDWGDFHDPVGEPVRRCYSLYPFAVRQGRGVALLSAFMRAAFCEGVDTSTQAGLRQVVERAGLNWQEARRHLDSGEWAAEIEANRLALYECGLWGVPSFHLRRGAQTALATWGQDRLWLVSRTIQRLLGERQTDDSAGSAGPVPPGS